MDYTPPQFFILLTYSIPVVIKNVSTSRVENSVDPDQSDLNLQCFQKKINPGSAGQGLSLRDDTFYQFRQS